MDLKKNFLYFVLSLSVQLLSIRFFLNFEITKNQPLLIYFIYILISLIFLSFLYKQDLFDKVLKNKIFFSIIIASYTLFIFREYPESIGTERDDCYKIIFNNIFNFSFPYSLTPLGDPCSTGITALIFYFPSIFYENYFGITASISFILFYYLMKKFIDKKILIFIIYLQIFNLLAIEEAIGGSDYFLISFSYVIGIFYLKEYFDKGDKVSFSISLIFLYFFYGSRIIFIFLMPLNYLLSLFLYDIKKVHKYFFILNFLVLLSISFPALINFDQYHPIHIIYKAYNLVGNYGVILILIFFLIILIMMKNIKTKFKTIRNINLITINLLFFIFPIVVGVIYTFVHRLKNNSFENWEGLSYLILIYPALCIFLFFLLNKLKK